MSARQTANALLQALSGLVPGSFRTGSGRSLLAVAPVRHGIFTGFTTETSSAAPERYVWAFVQPLYLFPQHFISFGFGVRLGPGSGTTWDVGDVDTLRQFAEPMVSALVAASTPRGFLERWIGRPLLLPSAVQIGRAMTLLRLGDTSGHTVLEDYVKLLNPAVPWQRTQRAQLEQLLAWVAEGTVGMAKVQAQFDQRERDACVALKLPLTST